jgi:hypothetical protein
MIAYVRKLKIYCNIVATNTYKYFLLHSHLSLSVKRGLVTDLSAWEMTEMQVT